MQKGLRKIDPASAGAMFGRKRRITLYAFREFDSRVAGCAVKGQGKAARLALNPSPVAVPSTQNDVLPPESPTGGLGPDPEV